MADSAAAASEPAPLIIGPDAPEDSISVGVARSGLWAIGGQIAVLGASFLATPFTIRLLGPAKYGVWALLGTILNYIAIADLGMSDTSTTFSADAHARADDMGEAQAVWTALCVTTILTSAAAVAAWLAGPFLVAHVLHVQPRLRSESVLALRLVCLAAVATSFTSSINTPQQVRLRWRSLTLATNGPAAVQVALAPLVLLLLAGGVATMALLAALAAVVSAVLNAIGALRLAPALRRVRASRVLVRPMVRNGVALALSGLALIPLTTAERLFLAYFHSPKIVAYYAVAATLGSLLLVMPIAVVRPLIPALVRLTASGRDQEHRRLYEQSLLSVLLVLTPLTIIGAFVSRPFLTLWAGPAYGAHSTLPFYLVLLGFWFTGVSYIPTVQLMATRQTPTLAILRIAEIPPYLVLAAVLSRDFGAPGAAAAWSARSLVDAVALFILVRRRHGLGWPPLVNRLRPGLLILLLMAAPLTGVALATDSLAWRLSASAVALGLYCAATWRFTLNGAERERASELLASVRVTPRLRPH